MKKYLICLLALFLLSCVSSPSKMNHVNLGMSKAEVVSILGSPQSTRAQGRVEYLVYQFLERNPLIDSRPSPYFVRLVDGKVESYGKVGDFDSTKEEKLNLDVKTE